jgi:hypothetical protein
MGDLIKIIKREYKNIEESYKENTMFFYNAYQKSSKEVTNINVGQIQLGAFYFLQYQDDSNWMQYSPIFTVDFKKFNDLIIIYAINFNFIPLQIRTTIFDRYITQKDLEENSLLNTTYESVYKVLLQYGYEYALVEYNLKQIKFVHKINNSLIPKFLYSGFPKNKYDPIKLYNIWKTKLKTKEQRHKEMMLADIKDFYDTETQILNDYDALEKHIDRIRKSYEKYIK